MFPQSQMRIRNYQAVNSLEEHWRSCSPATVVGQTHIQSHKNALQLWACLTLKMSTNMGKQRYVAQLKSYYQKERNSKSHQEAVTRGPIEKWQQVPRPSLRTHAWILGRSGALSKNRKDCCTKSPISQGGVRSPRSVSPSVRTSKRSLRRGPATPTWSGHQERF